MTTTQCPHCQKQLKLNEKIIAKVRELPAGKSLGLKCPQCANTIYLDAATLPQQPPAETKPAQQPQAAEQKEQPPQAPGPGQDDRYKGAGKLDTVVTPPNPPDIGWLEDGFFEDKEVVEDIPRTLILMADSPQRTDIVEAIENIGYQPAFADSSADAIEKMQFVQYAGVILHSTFEPGGLPASDFQQYMRKMSMAKRRYIFYVLIGPEFRTLYDLQALANSANLVVNDTEIDKFTTIIRKSIPQYEELFGPIMEEMNALGR
ncbi:MAG: hypothetical protein ABFS19_13740 [Thermodesulfobacteriota bacterium]